MKAIRWAAFAFTLLMGLMNLPFVVDDGGNDYPMAFRATASVIGLAGIVAAVALARRLPWATPAVIAIGVVNAVGAVGAMADGSEGAAIGLTVSLLALATGVLTQVTAAGARTPSLT